MLYCIILIIYFLHQHPTWKWHCIALLCWCAVKKLLTHSLGTGQWRGITRDNQDWIGLCSVLRPRQHSIGYMGDGFHRSKTQPTVSKYWHGHSNVFGRPCGCRTNNLTNKNFYVRIMSTFFNVKWTQIVLSLLLLLFSVITAIFL